MPTFGKRSYETDYMRVFSSAMSSLKELQLASDVADHEVGLIRAHVGRGTHRAIEVRLIKEEDGVTVLAHITPPPTYQDTETYGRWVDRFFTLLETNIQEGRRATVDVQAPEPYRRVTYDVKKPDVRGSASPRWSAYGDTPRPYAVFIVLATAMLLIFVGIPFDVLTHDSICFSPMGLVILLLSAALIYARAYGIGALLAFIGGFVSLPIGFLAFFGGYYALKALKEGPDKKWWMAD
jgi:hypothetical protein